MHLTGWPSREIPSGTWLFNIWYTLLLWLFVGCPLMSQCELFFLHSFSPISHIQSLHWILQTYREMIEKIQSNLTPNKNQENIVRKLQSYRSDFDRLSFLVMAILVGKSKTLFQILGPSPRFGKLGSHIFFWSSLIYLLI